MDYLSLDLPALKNSGAFGGIISDHKVDDVEGSIYNSANMEILVGIAQNIKGTRPQPLRNSAHKQTNWKRETPSATYHTAPISLRALLQPIKPAL